MKRKLTPVVMLAAMAATLTISLTPLSAEAGRVPSREERQAQAQSNERAPRPADNRYNQDRGNYERPRDDRRDDRRNDDRRNDDRRNYDRPRDDGNINRAISAGSSRGRVLDTRPAGPNYVVRVQTPDGRRVDLTVDGRTGRVISEK